MEIDRYHRYHYRYHQEITLLQTSPFEWRKRPRPLSFRYHSAITTGSIALFWSFWRRR